MHSPPISPVRAIGSIVAVSAMIIIAVIYAGCTKGSPTDPAVSPPQPAKFETSGEEFLAAAMDEIESIADYQYHAAKSLGRDVLMNLPARERKQVIRSSQADTTYVYGEITPDGYGAVVTERHAYPKGILLITVRRSYGKPGAKVVTETKRFITEQDFLYDSTEQSNITEVYGLSADTLVTHVNRNGTIETYTFRLPVITRVTNPVDGSVRVTTRYGSSGTVRTEIRDGEGSLIQFRESYGDSTGALTTYTEYADGSWRNSRTVGQADGAVLHEITSGP